MSYREEFIPSITTNGSVPENEVIPLIRTEGLPPGLGLEIIFKPACPCSASSILRGLICESCSSFTIVTEPEMFEDFYFYVIKSESGRHRE